MAIDLAHLHFQSRSFKARLFHSLAIVDDALKRSQRPYVAFSGGKDSVALTALVHLVRADVPVVWSDDELEYPETVDYMRRLMAVAGDQLVIVLGWARHADWFDPWTSSPSWRAPFTGSLHIECDTDDWAAEAGFDLTFTGLRMEESAHRKAWLLHAGPLYGVRSGTGRRCCPLMNWTADDVWALIAGWGLPYNAVYDRLAEIQVPRAQQRVGPLPLARRSHLDSGWPDLLGALEAKYGNRWT